MLKALSLAVMLVATNGVRMDIPLPKDGGTSVADAGVVTPAVVGRRAEFKARMEALAANWTQKSHKLVAIGSILYATQVVSDSMDACIVLLNTPDGQVGLFFMFREGKWNPIPEDFR